MNGPVSHAHDAPLMQGLVGGKGGWRDGGREGAAQGGRQERKRGSVLFLCCFCLLKRQGQDEQRRKKNKTPPQLFNKQSRKKSSNMQVTFQRGHRIHRGVLRCDLAVTCEPLSRCGPPGKLIGEDGNPFPFLFSVSNSWQHFKGMVHPKLTFRPSGSPLHS